MTLIQMSLLQGRGFGICGFNKSLDANTVQIKQSTHFLRS